MSAGEVVSYYIGQCGVQTGSACWNLFNTEHGIGCNGFRADSCRLDDRSFTSFYKECPSGVYVPRAVFCDLESTVIDEIRTGCNRRLFPRECLLSSHEGAANNFARGFYTSGRLMIKEVIFTTRKQVESCNALKSLVVMHSYGGGTGSGFMSMLLEYLSTEYNKITKIDIGLIPNETLSCSSVEPYNSILGMHHPMENTDLAILYENEPLYTLCKTKLQQNQPMFCHLNQIVSQIISGITSCTRFESPIGCNLNDIQTNIVPYPRIHFPLLSYAPIGNKAKNDRSHMSTEEVTKSAFNPLNQLVSVEANEGKVMAGTLLYRGPVSSQDVFDALYNIKRAKDQEWVDWCPTGFKVGITTEPFNTTPHSIIHPSLRSVTLLKNSTVVRTVFNRLGQKFWQLFSRKAFLHWFVAEGMDEKEFKDAFDDLMLLSNDLLLLEKATEELDEAEMTMLYPKGGDEEEGEDKEETKEEGKKEAENDNQSAMIERSDTLTNKSELQKDVLEIVNNNLDHPSTGDISKSSLKPPIVDNNQQRKIIYPDNDTPTKSLYAVN